MSIPSKLKIGPLTYNITQETGLTFRDIPHNGLHYGRERNIILESQITPERELEVLLHEILHAVFFTKDLRFKQKVNRETEERIVAALAHGLTEVFLENQELKEYILETTAGSGFNPGNQSP